MAKGVSNTHIHLVTAFGYGSVIVYLTPVISEKILLILDAPLLLGILCIMFWLIGTWIEDKTSLRTNYDDSIIDNQNILYDHQDFYVVAKPPNIPVHKDGFRSVSPPLLQQVRDLVGHHVWPIHRLDRQCSGVIVFSKNTTNSSPHRNPCKMEQRNISLWFVEE